MVNRAFTAAAANRKARKHMGSNSEHSLTNELTLNCLVKTYEIKMMFQIFSSWLLCSSYTKMIFWISDCCLLNTNPPVLQPKQDRIIERCQTENTNYLRNGSPNRPARQRQICQMPRKPGQLEKPLNITNENHDSGAACVFKSTHSCLVREQIIHTSFCLLCIVLQWDFLPPNLDWSVGGGKGAPFGPEVH